MYSLPHNAKQNYKIQIRIQGLHFYKKLVMHVQALNDCYRFFLNTNVKKLNCVGLHLPHAMCKCTQFASRLQLKIPRLMHTEKKK